MDVRNLACEQNCPQKRVYVVCDTGKSRGWRGDVHIISAMITYTGLRHRSFRWPP